MKTNEAVSGGWVGSIWRGLGHLLAKFREIISVAFSIVVIGCCHRRLGRPRTVEGVTYRACLDCSMLRSFDPEAWRMYGAFSYTLLEEAAGPTAELLPFRPTHSVQATGGPLIKRAA